MLCERFAYVPRGSNTWRVNPWRHQSVTQDDIGEEQSESTIQAPQTNRLDDTPSCPLNYEGTGYRGHEKSWSSNH